MVPEDPTMVCFDIVDANARAVSQLQKGWFKAAIQSLEYGLRQLHSVVLANASNMEDDADVGDATSDLVCRDDESRKALRIETSECVCPPGDLDIDAGVFTMFTRPMVLSCSNEQVLGSVENQNRTTAVLMFNMALAYQCLPRSEAHLRRSLKLCTLTVDLLERLERHTQGDYTLYVAGWNNQGCIHSYFSDRAKASDCLEQLEILLLPVDSDCGSVLDRESYEVFSDVVCTLILCRGRHVLVSTAAAA